MYTTIYYRLSHCEEAREVSSRCTAEGPRLDLCVLKDTISEASFKSIESKPKVYFFSVGWDIILVLCSSRRFTFPSFEFSHFDKALVYY